jgi:hypothetical protein
VDGNAKRLKAVHAPCSAQIRAKGDSNEVLEGGIENVGSLDQALAWHLGTDRVRALWAERRTAAAAAHVHIRARLFERGGERVLRTNRARITTLVWPSQRFQPFLLNRAVFA